MGSEVYANPANAGGSSAGVAVSPLRDALAKIANLEARIKELTERRPMHTMPERTPLQKTVIEDGEHLLDPDKVPSPEEQRRIVERAREEREKMKGKKKDV